MAFLAAPTIDWSGGTAPQAQGLTFPNQYNHNPTQTGQPVITQTMRAAPSFSSLSSAGSSHTI